MPRSADKSSPPRRPSALRAGALTSAAQLLLAGSAAGAAILLAQRFGRNARTDGLLAAYQIYIVLTVAAQAFRSVVVPDLTLAAAESRLGGELRAYAGAVVAVGVPASVACGLLAGPIGDAVTGSLPHAAAHSAARAVVWLVPAAFAQLLAGICASALAARDSYGTAAAGYAAGGVAGLVLFAALAGSGGLVALAWGVALNASLAVAIPLVRLARDGVLSERSRAPLALGRRLAALVGGAAVPVALQAFSLVALRLLAGIGVGRVTSFSYAYLLAATLAVATAFSLGLISSAPLTRRGVDSRVAVDHVVHSAWISLALAGAAAGVLALAGGRVFSALLGPDYRGLGRLFLELTPWLVASTAFYAVFPLVFVRGSRRLLVPLALAAVAVDVPLAWAMRRAWGVPGVAVSLCIATALVVAALMLVVSAAMLVPALVRLVLLAAGIAAATAAAFGLPALVLGRVAAAVVGFVLYTALLLATRRLGLAHAWAYVRGLHTGS